MNNPKLIPSRNKREGVYWCKCGAGSMGPGGFKRIPQSARYKYSSGAKSISKCLMWNPDRSLHSDLN